MSSPRDHFFSTEIARRFALNTYHCWTKGIFEDPSAVESFFKLWWRDCISQLRDSNSDEALDLLSSRVSSLWGKPAGDNAVELSRVVPFATFFSPPTSARPTDYSLLRTKYITDTYGVGLKSISRGDVFKKIERVNGDADALRPGAQVRGQMPLSWATSRQIFDAERRSSGSDYSDNLAWRICRVLGLEGRYYYNAALFQLNYPAKISGDRSSVRRPTAIEGAGNRYFRARRDGAHRHNFGYTIDLDRFDASQLNVDGGVEAVVATVEMSADFTWRGLGFLVADTTPKDEEHFKDRLTVGDVEVALASAIDLIERLCL